jgi:cold shock protein
LWISRAWGLCRRRGCVCGEPQKGYGFIQPQDGGRDVFVHISAVEKAGLPGLNEGQVVEYEELSDRGKTSVGNLKVSR